MLVVNRNRKVCIFQAKLSYAPRSRLRWARSSAGEAQTLCKLSASTSVMVSSRLELKFSCSLFPFFPEDTRLFVPSPLYCLCCDLILTLLDLVLEIDKLPLNAVAHSLIDSISIANSLVERATLSVSAPVSYSPDTLGGDRSLDK